MHTRNVCHYREPPLNSKKLTSTLSVDLLELGLSAVKETLQTGMHTNAWAGLFKGSLSPKSAKLIWRDDGLGQGRELKRSFSNILGRFLARYYLEKYEGILELIPIEGNSMTLSTLNVRRKTGLLGDMPDWFGFSGADLVIAEAKGSHDKGKWERKAAPWVKKARTMQKAMQQVERVEIVRTGKKSGSSIAFKGWSVGSRWGTEKNGVDPWLMAIDPELGEEELSPDEFNEVQRSIVQRSNELMLRSMGFNVESETGITQPLTKSFLTEDRMFSIDLGDDAFIEKGLHAIAGPFGFMPLNSRRDLRLVRLAQRAPFDTALVTLSKQRFSEEISFAESEPRGDNFVSRNGVSLKLIDDNARFRIAD